MPANAVEPFHPNWVGVGALWAGIFAFLTVAIVMLRQERREEAARKATPDRTRPHKQDDGLDADE